jgi:hypothetical protein
MQIRNSQTELVITSAGSAMLPRFATTIGGHFGGRF